jgi:hypothetical protein
MDGRARNRERGDAEQRRHEQRQEDEVTATF